MHCVHTQCLLHTASTIRVNVFQYLEAQHLVSTLAEGLDNSTLGRTNFREPVYYVSRYFAFVHVEQTGDILTSSNQFVTVLCQPGKHGGSQGSFGVLIQLTVSSQILDEILEVISRTIQTTTSFTDLRFNRRIDITLNGFMEVDIHTHQIFLGSIHRLSQVTVQFSEAARPISFLHNVGHKVLDGYQWVNETFAYTLDETS